jgi:hypothetical protein
MLLASDRASTLVSVSPGADVARVNEPPASRQPREKSAARLTYQRFTTSRARDASGVHKRSRRVLLKR